jgi:hypothetical protein
MTLSLARKLKEAGFPHVIICDGDEACQYGWKAHVEMEPTFEELLDAIPGFERLEKGGRYRAYAYADGKAHKGEGPTAEEAMANLYLSIYA